MSLHLDERFESVHHVTSRLLARRRRAVGAKSSAVRPFSQVLWHRPWEQFQEQAGFTSTTPAVDTVSPILRPDGR